MAGAQFYFLVVLAVNEKMHFIPPVDSSTNVNLLALEHLNVNG